MVMNQGAGEWRKVGGGNRSGRESVRWDIMKNETGGIAGPVSTFYVTDFGEQWKAKDLFFEFKDLGMLDEIFIPPNKDWRGLRYGFVRFLNLEDERIVEINLNNLLLDGRKINANISKFKTKEFKSIRVSGVKRNVGVTNIGSNGGREGALGAGTSHATYDQVGGKTRSFLEAVKGNGSSKKPDGGEACKSLFFKSTVEERKGMEKAMVGITVAPGLTYGVGKSLIEEGIFSAKATSLGPNLCLLEESIEGDLKALMEEGGEWKKSWFKEVRSWKLEDVECYRATWISVYGIPCHGRNRRFLETVLADIGIIAHFDFLNIKPERLNVLTFMVFTNLLEPIRNKFKVCLDGTWICLMVIEDLTVRDVHGDVYNGE
ncbi:uncharacterized protein LOC131618827 [Vicia villosa]|uniref:uncharacterized protein LOC131618827 n=1 Tax=Vicia villosa TaxID=3911 RepID=UPI00273BF67A|nr:uncharacterized protein LOC131618827 [Vicia villosa]